MKHAWLAALLCVLPVTVVRADDPTGAEAEVLPGLIDHGCFDIVDALNGCEQITLLVSATDPGAADLVIYPDRRTDDAEGPLLIVRGIAFNGAMWGMSPSLEAAPGALLLHSEQSGIGRFPWFQTLTIAHDGSHFVITGFAYSSYDRATARSVTCEVDLATGDYRFDAEEPVPEDELATRVIAAESGILAQPPGAMRLQDWQAGSDYPAPCAEAVALMWANDG